MEMKWMRMDRIRIGSYSYCKVNEGGEHMLDDDNRAFNALSGVK